MALSKGVIIAGGVVLLLVVGALVASNPAAASLVSVLPLQSGASANAPMFAFNSSFNPIVEVEDAFMDSVRRGSQYLYPETPLDFNVTNYTPPTNLLNSTYVTSDPQFFGAQVITQSSYGFPASGPVTSNSSPEQPVTNNTPPNVNSTPPVQPPVDHSNSTSPVNNTPPVVQPPANDAPGVTFPTPQNTQGELVEFWWGRIVRICNEKWGLDPYYIAAVVRHESWFDAAAFNAGERQLYESGQNPWFGQYYGKGLMQPTGPWVAGVPFPQVADYQYNMPVEAVISSAPRMDNAYNGTQNLDRSCWYFAALLRHYQGSYPLAVTAYHYGFFGTDSTRNPNQQYTNEVEQYRRMYLDSASRRN